MVTKFKRKKYPVPGTWAIEYTTRASRVVQLARCPKCGEPLRFLSRKVAAGITTLTCSNHKCDYTEKQEEQ